MAHLKVSLPPVKASIFSGSGSPSAWELGLVCVYHPLGGSLYSFTQRWRVYKKERPPLLVRKS